MNIWYKTLASIHHIAIVGGSFSMLFGAILATEFAINQANHENSLAIVRNLQYAKTRLAAAQPCTPAPTPTVTVSGLGWTDIPRLPESLKLSYEKNGYSQYITEQTSDDVIQYYLPEFSSRCWTISSIRPGEVEWVRDGVSMQIAARESAFGGRTIVSYSIINSAVAVRGYSYKLAQDTGVTPPPPPPSGETYSSPPPTYYQAPTGQYPDQSGSYPTQQYPTPTYQQPTQYPQAPACPSDQYFCNDKCIPNGNACGSYQYYKPGDGTAGQNPSSYPSGYQQPIQQEPHQYQPSQAPEDPNKFPGQFGQGEQGQGENQYRAQYDAQRLEGMKRGLEQFSRGFKQMERMITRMKKTLKTCSVAIPQELQAAIDEAPKMIEAIQKAETVEDLEQLMNDIPEVGAAMQEWGPRLGDMTQLCEMLKHTNREVKNVERRLNQLKTAAKKNQTIQELVAQLDATVAQMKTAVTEAKQLATTGDVEAAVDRLENGFFDQMEEFWSSVQQIEMVRNLTQGLRQAKSELRKADARIKQLERGKKIDAATASELRGLLSDIKAKIGEVEAVDRKDTEAVMSLAEELWDRMEAFQDRMEELGQGFYETTVKGGKERVDIELPDAFKFESTGGGGFPASSPETGF